MPYRKIDTRIHNDERFRKMKAMERLLWFSLLTHPQMTPMGAGVISASALEDCLDQWGGSCWICEGPCTRDDHHATGILKKFTEEGTVLLDNGLVVLKNFLLYNAPDNPSILAGWIEICESLPRSPVFKHLYEHLSKHVLPRWLHAGLLKPLADQQPRGLKDLYWGRIAPYTKKAGRKKTSVKSKNKNRCTNTKLTQTKHLPKQQEQEQEQEQEQDRDQDLKKTPVVLKNKRVKKPHPGEAHKKELQALSDHHADLFGRKSVKVVLDDNVKRIVKVLESLGLDSCYLVQEGHKALEKNESFMGWANAYPPIRVDGKPKRTEPNMDWIERHRTAGERVRGGKGGRDWEKEPLS